MKGTLRILAFSMAVLFGAAPAAEAVNFNRHVTPKRIREERQTRQGALRARRRASMTPEEKAARKERKARIRSRLNRYLINPIKKLRPRRHPGKYRTETKEEAAARRRKALKEKWDWIIPDGRSEGDKAVPESGRPANVQPASGMAVR